MIDLSEEHLLAVRDVPRRLPARPAGRRIHISAIYRWIQRGVRGVRLEAIRIGGTTYTSGEALQRFADQLSTRNARLDPSRLPTTRTRQRQVNQASKRLSEILGPSKGAEKAVHGDTPSGQADNTVGGRETP